MILNTIEGGLEPIVGVDSPSLKGTRVLDKKIMLIAPWYRSVAPQTAFCFASLYDKTRCRALQVFGDAYVAHSRNRSVDAFLKTDSEWALHMDDDMIFPFGNARWFRANTGWKNFPDPFAGFHTIDRLLAAGKSLVGGFYFGRWPNANGVYGESPNPSEVEFIRKGPHDLVKPTRWVGTGCLLTHRTVFEDVEKKFPLLARGADGTGGQWFSPSEHSLRESVRSVRTMLSVGPMTGEKAMKAYAMLEDADADARVNSWLGMGEDVTFCNRARLAGHQPYVDMGLVCGHIGAICQTTKLWQ